METRETAVATAANVGTFLAEYIDLDKQKKDNKKAGEEIAYKIEVIKEKIKDVYIEMGVNSMKSGKKNIYLTKQIFAGLAEDAPKSKLAEALTEMDMDEFITCNSKKLTSYVKEICAEHPEFYNEDGDLIAESAQILAALPEPFNTMFKVSDKMDIRIRNS